MIDGYHHCAKNGEPVGVTAHNCNGRDYHYAAGQEYDACSVCGALKSVNE